MDIHIVTGFPGMVSTPLQQSILKRAQDKGLVEYHIYDLRNYTQDKHRQIDDYPYGGGPGMVLKPEPFFRCLESILEKYSAESSIIISLTPQGETFSQKKAYNLANFDHLIFICGHYKGIDQRVEQYFSPEKISIGNYVVSSGEIAALVIIDSVVRLVPGVLNDFDSAATDSFQGELLDCPYYTRPATYRDMPIPEVLISGNHAKIKEWRKKKAIENTLIKQKKDSFGTEFEE